MARPLSNAGLVPPATEHEGACIRDDDEDSNRGEGSALGKPECSHSKDSNRPGQERRVAQPNGEEADREREKGGEGNDDRKEQGSNRAWDAGRTGGEDRA